MKVQRVYIDTSVLGGCFDIEFAEWSNALVQDFRTGRLKPILSDVVEAEVQDAPAVVQRIYSELLTLSVDVVTTDDAALDLADIYQ